MLTQRQELILQAIVRQFTVTGQPVGSKLLAEVLPFKVSSATIRNEMVVLEHEGLVKKEHSSSVRRLIGCGIWFPSFCLSRLSSYIANRPERMRMWRR